MNHEKSLSRRSLIQKLTIAPFAIGAFAALQAEAEAKAPQITVFYRKKPHGNKACAGCEYFLVNKQHPAANGSCKRVAGSISPNGYCVLWHDAKH